MSGMSAESTRSTCGSRAAKSGSSPPGAVDGALSAIPRSPNSVACFAAASVPECQRPLPRFVPMLIPDRTRSTSDQWWTPSATQSAGVPLTRHASTPSGNVERR